MRQRAQGGPEGRGAIVDILQKFLVHGVDHRAGPGADDRVAAEGRTVAARAHARGGFFAGDDRADGQPAAQALGQRDDIGFEVVIFAREELAGAADAGLHFVNDEQDIARGAEIGDPVHIVGLQRHDAALALHKLHHDGAGAPVARGGGQGVEVPGRDIGEVRREGAEVVVEHLLPGGGQRGERAAVERVDERDDLAAAFAVFVGAVLARAFDRALIGLGAGIAEKHPVQPGALAQPPRQPPAGGGIVQVGGVLHKARLLGDGLEPGRVGEAERIDADAGGEIEIGPAVCVAGDKALAAFDDNGAAGVGVHDVLLVPVDDFFAVHGISPFIRRGGCVSGKTACRNRGR